MSSKFLLKIFMYELNWIMFESNLSSGTVTSLPLWDFIFTGLEVSPLYCFSRLSDCFVINSPSSRDLLKRIYMFQVIFRFTQFVVTLSTEYFTKYLYLRIKLLFDSFILISSFSRQIFIIILTNIWLSVLNNF